MAYRNKDKIIQGGAREEIGVQSESYSLFFWSLNRDRLEVEKIHYPSSRIVDRAETWYNTVSTKYDISRSLKLQLCSISLLIPAKAVANALVLEKVMGNSLVPTPDFDCQVWKSSFPFTLQAFFPRTFLFDFFFHEFHMGFQHIQSCCLLRQPSSIPGLLLCASSKWNFD